MTVNDRIIFQFSKDKVISKEEFERLTKPYEQQKTLLKRLAVWTETAVSYLETYGYASDATATGKVIFSKKIPCYDEETGNDYLTLFFHPGVVSEDAVPEEKAACEVLKTAQALWQSLFQDDKLMIANLSIEFGLAVAVAHATPYEELTIIGKRRKEIPVNAGKISGESQTTTRKPEWSKWKDEADKVRKKYPNISTNKSEVARKVQKRLNLRECLRTISNRIFDD